MNAATTAYHHDDVEPTALPMPRSGSARLGDSVRFWLHAEGAAAAVAGLAIYGSVDGSWPLLIPLLLLPDLSLLGFVGGPRLGSLTYNLVHNWVIGLAALGAGWALESTPLVLVGAVLVAHVGADRLLGYGLKYPTAFKDTHLQRV